MSRFCRVAAAQAGPEALGILVAPSARTLVILRPRALEYDLLPIRTTSRNGLGSGFLDLERPPALAMAQALGQALETGAAGVIAPIPAAGHEGYWIQAEVGEFTLIACRRVPGQPYQAHVFPALDDARDTAAKLRRILCPAAEGRQELYCNTQSFEK